MADLEVLRHNYTVLVNLKKGDLLEIKRKIIKGKIHVYSHWAVYVGDEMIIHRTTDGKGSSSVTDNPESAFTICGVKNRKAFVKLDDFWDVACRSKVDKNNSKDEEMRPLRAEEIVDRAQKRIGEVAYNVLWSNCEHFVNFCRYGDSQSDQADTVFSKAYLLLKRVGYEAVYAVVLNVIKNTGKCIVGSNFAVGVGVAVVVVAVDAYFFEGKLAIASIDFLAPVLQDFVEKVLPRHKIAVGGLAALATVCEVIASTDKKFWGDKLNPYCVDALVVVCKVIAHVAKRLWGRKFVAGSLAVCAVVKIIVFVGSKMMEEIT